MGQCGARMDRSPSSHQFASPELEDKAASEASEGVGGAGRASRPTSLLDLPDELLLQIYEEVYESLRSKVSPSQAGLLAPVQSFLVCQRLYAVVRPIWFRSLRFFAEDMDDHLGNLLRRPHLYRAIRSLETEEPSDFPVTHFAVLSLFTNLTSLRITFTPDEEDDEDDAVWVPTHFTEALKLFPVIQSLRIQGSLAQFEDPNFSLDSMPFLTTFLATSFDLLDVVCTNGFANLHRLILGTETAADLSLPWRTVKWLHFAPDGDRLSDGRQLVKSLQDAVEENEDPLPLQRLTFDFPCLRLPTTSTSLAFDQTHFRTVLELLVQSTLKRLDLSDVDTLQWGESSLSLPSVEVISLRGDCPVHADDNLVNLFFFLSMFPSLFLLSVEGFVFSESTSQGAAAIQRASPFFLPLRHPALAAFLAALRSTQVLEFRYRPDEDMKEIRWGRLSKQDDFKSECWTLG
ncbi:hypothetical protein JCM6882_000136 [Rhodosporidiobolus microsporus]